MRLLLVGSSHVATLLRSRKTLTESGRVCSFDYLVASRSHQFEFYESGGMRPERDHSVRWSGPLRKFQEYDVIVYGAVGEKPYLVDRSHPLHPDQIRPYSEMELDLLVRQSPILAGHNKSLRLLRANGFSGRVLLVPYIRPVEVSADMQSQWTQFCRIERSVVEQMALDHRAELVNFPAGQEEVTDKQLTIPLKPGEVSVHGNREYAHLMNLSILGTL